MVIVARGSENNTVAQYYKDKKVYLAFGRDNPAEMDRSLGGYHSLMDINLAIAVDHLTLVAAEEGLGTCWIAAIDEQEIKKLFSVPEDMRVLIIMPAGYTASWSEPRPRKALEEIVCYDTYN